MNATTGPEQDRAGGPRISGDSRVEPDTEIVGPVRFTGHASAQDGSRAEASGPGRCVLLGASLTESRVVDVRAAASALTRTRAARSSLIAVAALDSDLDQSRLHGGPGAGGRGPGMRLEGSTVLRSTVVCGQLLIADSTLADVDMHVDGRIQSSVLLEARIAGTVELWHSTTAPVRLLGSGAPGSEQLDALYSGIMVRLDGILGNGWRSGEWEPAWSPAGAERPRATIAGSTISGSWITGGVRGSRVTGSHIAGRVSGAEVADSAVGAAGAVLAGAKVSGAIVHGTVQGVVDGALVPRGAWIPAEAEILDDGHVAVARIEGRTFTACRTREDDVVLVDHFGQRTGTADTGVPAACRALVGQVLGSFGGDPLLADGGAAADRAAEDWMRGHREGR